MVGAGVVGLASAVGLARAGHAVTMFEPADTLHAPSWNNAGHLAVEQVAPLASMAMVRSVSRRRFGAGGALHLPWRHARTWAPFGARLLLAARPHRYRHGARALGALLAEAMPAWRRLVETLGVPALLREDGHLLCWNSAATAERGRRTWQQADTGAAVLRDATPTDLAVLAGLLGPDAAIHAARFDGTGQIADLGLLAVVLNHALADAGGTVVPARAELALERGRARVAGHQADLVVVAAGLGSGALLRPLRFRVPIVAERGYHVRASADRWPTHAPPIVWEDRSLIVTRYADRVQAASFVEVAAPDAPPDSAKWERLEAHLRALRLPIEPPFTRWMGARPTLPDYLPAIGRSARVPNLLYAFGHQHLGLTLAAVTGEAVAALAEGRVPAVDLSPFGLARFGGLDGRPATGDR